MPKVLVSDPIAQEGLDILAQVAEVDYKPKLPKEELLQIIGDYDALMVRSETKATAEVIEAGKKLRIIGRAGVGVDNIDVQAATLRGIAVVNSPEGNTIAAAELSFALLLALARNIPQADASLRSGEWQRSKFVGTEVYKKTLGVIGLGKIGFEVARRGRGFGMNVIAYDLFANPQRAQEAGIQLASLDEVYHQSDFITLHVPKNDETKGMINQKAFAKMKNGVRIINVARGGIVDEAALAEAIKAGKVAGAALDVFSSEPPPADLEALSMPQNVVTPHLGASTEEAQSQVAIDVAEQIAQTLQGGVPRSPVNMPSLSSDMMTRLEPYFSLAQKMGSFLAQLVREPVDALEVHFVGDWQELPVDLVARSAVAGLLGAQLSENVNLINAPVLAQERGIKWSQTLSPAQENYAQSLRVIARFQSQERRVSGTVFGKNDLRITHIDDFHVDLIPEGNLVVTQHNDKPGMIGKVGTVLGGKGINIGGMHVGRERAGGKAIMALQVDHPIAPESMDEIRQTEGMETAVLVRL